MPLSILSGILSAVTGAAGELLTDWREGRANQRAVRKAVADNQIRLALDAAQHNSNWEMAALAGRDRFLRRVSFSLFSAPMIWAAVDPAGARAYFTDALAALPDWYVTGYLAMLGAIWGLSELRGMKR